MIGKYLIYPELGLPELSKLDSIGRIDPSAIASRILIKTFGLRISACQRNTWQHEARRGREFVRVYADLLTSCDLTINNCQILELGCGSGAIALGFTELSAKVTAIDLCDGRIFRGSQFAIGNGIWLPFPDASFEAVSITSVFHHIQKGLCGAVLSEAIRVTKPYGLIFIQEDIPDTRFFGIRNILMRWVDDLVSGAIGTHQADSHRTKADWILFFQLKGLKILGVRSRFPTWLGIGIEKAFFVLRRENKLNI